MSRGVPNKSNVKDKKDNRYAKMVRLPHTANMTAFIDAQKSFSESVRLLILEYIARHNGVVGDVCREFELQEEEVIMQGIRMAQGKEPLARQPLPTPAEPEASSETSEIPVPAPKKSLEPRVPSHQERPVAPPMPKPSRITSFDDADDDDDEIPECYR